MRVATRIYRDAYGYRVIWQELGRPRERRFPPDTPLKILTAYRDQQVRAAADLASVDRSGRFARDVVRYLRQRTGRPSYPSDRTHLQAWVRAFPKLSRWAVTPERCATVVAGWLAQGYKSRTIRHRVRVLRELTHALDGTLAPTPVDDLDLPRIEKPRPIAVSPETIRTVAANLRRQENPGIGRLRTAKTRARFLVLATTGQRPAQLMRAQPFDLDLERRIWTVRPAKGDRGALVYLNDDMRAAWQLFIAAQAWGHYDTRSFARRLRYAGWPRGIRPYNLRHSIGLTLAELGVDLGEIAAHMGHADVNTTRTFYVPAIPARQQAASRAIDHRIVAPGLTLPRASATPGPKRKRSLVEFPNDLRTRAIKGKGRLRRLKTSNSA